MARIKFSSAAKVRGSRQTEDFSASLSVPSRTVPAQPGQSIYLPSCVVQTQAGSFTTADIAVSFSGNSEGAYVRVDDTDNLQVVGTTVQKLTNSYMEGQPITVYAGNKFGERKYTATNPAYATVTPQVIDFGVFDFNSLAGQSKRLVEQLFAGVAPTADRLDQFLGGGTYDPTTPGGPALTPNPNRIAPSLDMTGISVHRSSANGTGLPIVLVSPRHFVAAKHIGVPLGDSVTFKRGDGTYQTATVVGTFEFPDPAQDTFDLMVGILSQDITGCAAYKTLPADWARYLPANSQAVASANNGAHAAFPVLVRASNPGTSDGQLTGNIKLNTNSPHLLVGWAGLCDALSAQGVYRMVYPVPPQANRTGSLFQAYRTLYPGDSGSPHFMPIPQATGHTMALISLTYGATTGPFLPNHITWLNQKMSELSAAQSDPRVFSIGTVDLSSFPVYA